MGFLSIFRSRDKPTNRTAGGSYNFFMGGSTSGKRVNERTAMGMTAVYSCVRILSEAVAGLPLHLYKYTDTGGKEKAVDHPLYFLLHDEPNPEMTSFVFRETLMCHLLLWGNAYAQIIRNGRGEVIALYPLMPDRMAVDRDDRGRIFYEYRVSQEDAHTLKEGTVQLSPSDVLHIPGLGFDGLVGYSPIAMAKNAIGVAIACEEYGAKFFANGAQPSGVLEHPGVLKDPGKIRESWNSTFGGSANANKVAVLEEGMKYSPISIAPEQAQFLETRKFQIDEIARIFRIPPHMVGDLEHATFSNIENQSIDFVKYTLDPWVCRIESSFNRRLLSENEKNICTCEKCGDVYRRVARKDGNHFSTVWRCCTRINEGPEACDGPIIREDELHAKILQAINEQLAKRSRVIRELKKMVSEATFDDYDDELARIEKSLADTQKELLNRASAKAGYDDLADEINRLRERKRDLLTKQAQDMGKVRIKKQAVEFLENQTTELTEYNDQLVRTLIEKITVRPDLSLTVEFKSGIIVEV